MRAIDPFLLAANGNRMMLVDAVDGRESSASKIGVALVEWTFLRSTHVQTGPFLVS